MTSYDLTQGSLIEHVKRIAISASVGYLFNTLYNVVDTFYAGKLSTDALAGMTISFPIFFYCYRFIIWIRKWRYSA